MYQKEVNPLISGWLAFHPGRIIDANQDALVKEIRGVKVEVPHH